MSKTENNMTYEQAMQELQQILANLQAEIVSVEDLERQVLRSKELITYCSNKLRGTQKIVDDAFFDE